MESQLWLRIVFGYQMISDAMQCCVEEAAAAAAANPDRVC